jgi:hypothetical protein
MGDVSAAAAVAASEDALITQAAALTGVAAAAVDVQAACDAQQQNSGRVQWLEQELSVQTDRADAAAAREDAALRERDALADKLRMLEVGQGRTRGRGGGCVTKKLRKQNFGSAFRGVCGASNKGQHSAEVEI